jgi:hypothetical protein
MKYKVILFSDGTDPTPQGVYTFYTYVTAYACCVSWLEVQGANSRARLWNGVTWANVTV